MPGAWCVVTIREMAGGSSSNLRILYEAKGCGYARCRVGNILIRLKGWWSLAHPRLCVGPRPSPTISINVAESQICHSSRPPAHTLTGAPRLLSRTRGACGGLLSGRLKLRRSIMVQALLIIGACTFAGAGLAATLMLERI